ncbi:hypothetical protein GCM10009550_61890 [Actinocorallia libanotica]|uniref:Uncharacterized protein n=1 Tax=Actinocorallia libanotica TaxID=46162 RepID=A0ABN1RUN0_9ACTN
MPLRLAGPRLPRLARRAVLRRERLLRPRVPLRRQDGLRAGVAGRHLLLRAGVLGAGLPRARRVLRPAGLTLLRGLALLALLAGRVLRGGAPGLLGGRSRAVSVLLGVEPRLFGRGRHPPAPVIGESASTLSRVACGGRLDTG